MGVNFGDIDNDGFLDVYFGTGWMSFDGLRAQCPAQERRGRSFEDITDSSRTGHLQKGHGISMADWVRVRRSRHLLVLGGGDVPSDSGYNALFQHPGHGRHWLKVKLVGVSPTARRWGPGSSGRRSSPMGPRSRFYGWSVTRAASAVIPWSSTSGLGDATSVTRLIVTWPTSQTTQTFTGLAADQSIVITEGSDQSGLLMTIDGLNIDIANEEELTGIEDMANPEYSIVARTLRARRDNLTATVELLSRRMRASSQS